ncbi:hypothetical protein ASE06_20035 [Sphingopyxis sp. Root214]|uniref:DUF11 domain-containing protein n=1 Tax=Sphingopyxis sp. Root214 TaxID=1736491 RepID=UPI0006F59553|nr:DUF11 domain-containing protein [Sphingopyxis sp. Root214]KQZ71684.1 hypothetical protein ASD73_17700 [Sphingopyxis sp. Root154]KRC05593.1 hypothetical protein ASE06_20035 [Sphingopyxis sp. Root214]
MVIAPVGGAKHRLLPSYSIIPVLAALALPTQAEAAGTRAGSTISNTASASFDTGGGTATVDSNRVDLLVDELLDVTVDSSNPADVPTTPGATGQLLTFLVTNNGNGVEAFGLATIANAGGDNYDPAVAQIYLDNGDGLFDASTDTLYTAGANDPSLNPDQSIAVFVLATTPGTVVDGNRGIVSLVAAAKTGTGDPGDSFASEGEGGGDAVVGSTGADGQDAGAFIVSAATVTLVKSAVVTNSLGTAGPVPGATITYTIVATVAGSGSVSGLAITDNIPADTSYVPGSIALGGSGLSDAADADAGDYNGTRVNVALGTVAGGQTRTVTFQTKID